MSKESLYRGAPLYDCTLYDSTFITLSGMSAGMLRGM